MTASHPTTLPAALPSAAPRGLSTGDVARLCQVSTRTVLRWFHTGVLPATRLDNGHHRVSREDLRQLLHLQGQPIPSRLAADEVVVVLEPGPGRRLRTRLMWDGHGGDARLVCVADAFELGAALVRHTPAVLVFDPTTPGLDPHAVCAFVQRHPRLRKMGLVMRTENLTRTARRQLFEAGIHAAVPGALRPADIRMLRRRWLQA